MANRYQMMEELGSELLNSQHCVLLSASCANSGNCKQVEASGPYTKPLRRRLESWLRSSTYVERAPVVVGPADIVVLLQIDLESSEDDIQEIQQEISVLATCASPFVTQYKASFLRGHKLWIVMEFLGGGSCLDLVIPIST